MIILFKLSCFKSFVTLHIGEYRLRQWLKDVTQAWVTCTEHSLRQWLQDVTRTWGTYASIASASDWKTVVLTWATYASIASDSDCKTSHGPEQPMPVQSQLVTVRRHLSSSNLCEYRLRYWLQDVLNIWVPYTILITTCSEKCKHQLGHTNQTNKVNTWVRAPSDLLRF